MFWYVGRRVDWIRSPHRMGDTAWLRVADRLPRALVWPTEPATGPIKLRLRVLRPFSLVRGGSLHC